MATGKAGNNRISGRVGNTAKRGTVLDIKPKGKQSIDRVFGTIPEPQPQGYVGNFGREQDPIFKASPAYGITQDMIDVWNSGGIAQELDPIFTASPAYTITDEMIANWNAGSGIDLSDYAYLPGRNGGQYLRGSHLAGEDLTLVGNDVDGGFVNIWSKIKVGYDENSSSDFYSTILKNISGAPELFPNNDIEEWFPTYSLSDWEVLNNNSQNSPIIIDDSDTGEKAILLRGDGLDGFSGYAQIFTTGINEGEEYLLTCRAKYSDGYPDATIDAVFMKNMDGGDTFYAIRGDHAREWVNINPSKVVDGSFENWESTPGFNYWFDFSASGHAMTQSTRHFAPIGGSYSAKFNGDGFDNISGHGYHWDTHVVPIVSGDYFFKAQVNSDTIGHGAYFLVQRRDSNDNYYWWNFQGSTPDTWSLAIDQNPIFPDSLFDMSLSGINTWQEFYNNVAINIPEDTIEVFFMFASPYADVYLDAVQLQLNNEGENLFTNDSFENFTGGNLVVPNRLLDWNVKTWNEEGWEGTSSFEADRDHHHSGGFSIKLRSGFGSPMVQYFYQTIDTEILDGSNVDIVLYGLGMNGGETMRAYLLTTDELFAMNWQTSQWVENDPNALPLEQCILTYQLNSGGFSSLNRSIPAPPGGLVKVFIGGAMNGDSFWIDDFDLIKEQQGAPDLSDFLITFNLTDDFETYVAETTVIVPPELQFGLIIGATTTGGILDNVTLKKDGTGTDLIQNGGFESAVETGSVPIDWISGDFQGQEGIIEKESNHVHTGQYAMKLSRSGNDGWATKYAGGLMENLEVGENYDFHFAYSGDGTVGIVGMIGIYNQSVEQNPTQYFNLNMAQWVNMTGNIFEQFSRFNLETNDGLYQEVDLVIPAPESGVVCSVFMPYQQRGVLYLDSFSFKIQDYSIPAINVWNFYNENDWHNLDENDKIIRFATDDGFGNQANYLTVNGEGKIENDFGTSVTGSNTGDETQSSIKTKLGQANGGSDGYLSGADWASFNSRAYPLGYTPEDVANKYSNADLNPIQPLYSYPTVGAVKGYIDWHDWFENAPDIDDRRYVIPKVSTIDGFEYGGNVLMDYPLTGLNSKEIKFRSRALKNGNWKVENWTIKTVGHNESQISNTFEIILNDSYSKFQLGDDGLNIDGNITADNLSGNNTGDQDLSGKEDVGVAGTIMQGHLDSFSHGLIATALQNVNEGTLTNLTGILVGVDGAIDYTPNNSADWDTAFGWGDHAGLYDLNGSAASIINGHTAAYDHTLIATALQSETDPVFTDWLDNTYQEFWERNTETVFEGQQDEQEISFVNLINSTDRLLIGATASVHDFPFAQLLVSRFDSGEGSSSNYGMVFESSTEGSLTGAAYGIFGVSLLTEEGNSAYGARFKSRAEYMATGTSYGAWFSCIDEHLGDNIGSHATVDGGLRNYCFKAQTSDLATQLAIVSFADNGNGGTTVTVDAECGFIDGLEIEISGTTHYNGDWANVFNVTTYSFDIATAYISNDATGLASKKLYSFTFFGEGGVLYNNGAIGIGTETPQAMLDVVGDSVFGDRENNNYAEFDDSGTLRLYGDATVFDDLLGDLTRTKTVGQHVTLNDTESTIDFASNSTPADYIFLNLQMSHKWKIGSDIFPHLHWQQASNATPNWLIQYRWQKNGGAKTTAWTDYKMNTNVFTYTSGTLNQISHGGAVTPPNGASLSDIFEIRVIRDTANASGKFSGNDTYSGTASTTSVDCHIEIDSLGSNIEYTK